MKRQFVASLLSLAMAGCAQSRSALSKGDSTTPGPAPPGPVAVTPVPSIYDTVNQGQGGPAIARTALTGPANPQWSGRAPMAGTAAPSQSGGAKPAPADAVRTTSAGPAASDAGAVPFDSRAAANESPARSPTGAAASPSASQPALAPVVAPASQPPITPVAAPRNPGPRRDRDPLLGPDPDLMPPMPDLAEMKSRNRPAAPPVLDLPAVKPPVSSAAPPGPDRPALKSPGSPPPLLAPEAPAARSSAGGAPPLESLPLEPAPAAPAAIVNPPSDPAVLPKAGAGSAEPAAKPAHEDKSTAAREPASAGSPAAPVPLEPAPPSSNVKAAVSARAPVPGPAPLRRDPQVVLASGAAPKQDATDRRRLALEPGCPIARVGDEVITYHDLVLATRENLSKLSLPRGQEFDTQQQMEMINHINSMRIDTLEGLIERCMLFQEAKRHIKDPKALARIFEEADRIWHDNEILPLEREYNVDNEQQLSERLAGRGRSLEAMKQSFRQLYLSRGFLHEKLKDRVNVELPDLLRYYNEHVDKHKFDRSAQIKWRELLVEVSKYESREAARRKADDLLKVLHQGEDFAKLAREKSDGLTSSRKEGGLMETSPGGYAVAAVNRAIESLPIGQVSGVIEGPQSFHIVKVENRRPAGPASFEEVQDMIKPIVQNQKFQAESAAYINKLRRDTLITIYSPKKTKKTQD
ncbi:MAG: peptidylprolyl isomerase [Isosphaerales bacterium]